MKHQYDVDVTYAIHKFLDVLNAPGLSETANLTEPKELRFMSVLRR